MGKFSRTLSALLRSYFIGVGVLTTLLFIILLVNLARLDFDGAARRVAVPTDGAVLVVDVGGHLRHQRTGRLRSLLSGIGFTRRDTWVSDLRRLFEVARTDTRVKAILLDMQEEMRGGLVDFDTVRALLADFVAASDIEVVCFLANGDSRGYFFASAADHIVVSPITMFDIPGPVLRLTYFGEALKKLGIGVQVVQTGRYKSAFEPFVRNRPSDDTLEMYRSIEQSLRGHLVDAIAAGRKRTQQEVAAWLQHSLFSAEQARERGLIDGISYREDTLTALKEQVQVEEHLHYRDYLASIEIEDAEDGRDGLALIEAIGQIFMDGNEWEMVLPRRVIPELQWALEDEHVRAVVLRVISPGGSALASELIWREVTRLAATKPVVVSMGDVAASGGYYLAAGASYLLAEPTTITGSIGVVGMIPNFKAFEDEYGVSFHVVSDSARRALYNAGEAMTDADYRLVHANLQAVYRIFKERVAAGRELELATVEQLAGGRVFTGAQALAVGLVDELGGLAEAFSKAKELAALDPARKYPLYRYDRGRFSFFDCMRATLDVWRCLEGSHSRIDPVAWRRYLHLLAEPQVLALWPHRLGW